jgi:hypothetical protein
MCIPSPKFVQPSPRPPDPPPPTQTAAVVKPAGKRGGSSSSKKRRGTAQLTRPSMGGSYSGSGVNLPT